MNEPNYYSILPAPVRYDKNLQDKAKLLYSEITALSNKSGYCYANNKYFAELYGISTRQVTRLIGALTQKGYIKVENKYYPKTKRIKERKLYPMTKMSRGIDKNVHRGIDKNVYDNNTSNNNKYKYRKSNFTQRDYTLEEMQKFYI